MTISSFLVNTIFKWSIFHCHASFTRGGFPKMVVPPFHTPKWSRLVGKPMGLLGKPTIFGKHPEGFVSFQFFGAPPPQKKKHTKRWLPFTWRPTWTIWPMKWPFSTSFCRVCVPLLMDTTWPRLLDFQRRLVFGVFFLGLEISAKSKRGSGNSNADWVDVQFRNLNLTNRLASCRFMGVV